ncbi:hypothetical protein DINM_003274 [Dirofilaria immitis]|nr:hypothetical protein [Dirofilaria immitis]
MDYILDEQKSFLHLYRETIMDQLQTDITEEVYPKDERVLFGMISSSSSLAATLNYHLENFEWPTNVMDLPRSVIEPPPLTKFHIFTDASKISYSAAVSNKKSFTS